MADTLTVLVVDDNREHAGMVSELVRASGAWPQAAIHTAGSHEEALRTFEQHRCDVAFLDYGLGARGGLALLREIRARGIDTPVIVLTAQGAEDVAVAAMKAGAADYLNKTALSVEAFDRAMRYALALHGEERQRRQAEVALRASESRFRALVENSHDVLLLMDADAQFVYTSPASRRLLGWAPEEIVGRSMFDFVHPDDADLIGGRFAEALRHPGRPVAAEIRFRHADGSWRSLEGTGVNRLDDPSLGAVVVNARDMTDRRRLEEQLRQSQKMEAVGRLAGGVAHDFNNLLTAILGYCSLILEELPEGSAVREDLEEIRLAGERAAALTRQLLAFSRRQILQPRNLDINDVIRQIEKLLRRLLSEDVDLVTVLGEGLPPVHVDPASVEQVLVNLTVNARDAMPVGGRLTIETACVELDAAYPLAHAAVVPGRYVMIAVTDTGHGMNAATRARVFEPFFTTKEQGKGVGLGLATTYGIVEQSGGYIWVYSEPGHGTVFKIYLPVVQPRAAGAGAASIPRESPWRGTETVLLVEDEDAVRALAREVLRRHGYHVLEARQGSEALLIAERHPEEIHLMVTDVVMPHMSGRELAHRLSGVRPNMRVLFMSGYTDHALVHPDLTPGAEFLQKPFTPDLLARKVRSVLG